MIALEFGAVGRPRRERRNSVLVVLAHLENNKIMNDSYSRLIERWFALSTLGCLLIFGMLVTGGWSGCVSKDAPPIEQTNSVKTVSRVVEMSAQLATFAAVHIDTNTAKYFRAAFLQINGAVTRGDYNPTNIGSLLRSISVDGVASDIVFLVITSALNVYKLVWEDAVTARLDLHLYVRPVLQSLARGIQLGLDGPRTEKRFSMPRR